MSFTDHSNHSHEDSPVTVDVIQRVKPGCEEAFEHVLTDLIAAAKSFDGHLGANVFRPAHQSALEYRIVFKFDHLSNLQRWESSAIRQKLLERAKRLTVGDAQLAILTGLETWFTLPNQQGIVAPPRYKMVVISGLTIYALINLINVVLLPIITPLPPLLRTFIATLLVVVMMTYVVMPRMTKLFAWWLYPKPRI